MRSEDTIQTLASALSHLTPMSNILAFKYVDLKYAAVTQTPRHGSAQAAGVDLWALNPVAIDTGVNDEFLHHVYPYQTKLLYTNLSVRIPDGHYGRIAPRSSVSLKGLIINAGVVDSDYRGEIKICVLNPTNEVISLDLSKPVAQLIIEHCIIVGGVKMVTTLDETERGDKGFGSTDINPEDQYNNPGKWVNAIRAEVERQPGWLNDIPESKRQKLEERVSLCDSCLNMRKFVLTGRCRTPTQCTCPTPQPAPELSLD